MIKDQIAQAKAKLMTEDGMISLGAGAIVAGATTALVSMATPKIVASVATVGGLLAVGTVMYAAVAGVAKGALIGYRSMKASKPSETPLPQGERKIATA